MAGKKKTTLKKTGYIDPVYQNFMKRMEGTLKSEEFYQYFMENVKQGKRSFQFSNRKLEKKIDKTWVEAVEACMEPFHNIIMNPRNFIIEKEEIVNVAVSRQATPEVLRHLTTHGKYIDEVTEDNVRPNHLLNKFKEDSWNTYENRFVYTLLEKTTEFVTKRFEAIFQNMGEEFGAFLKVDSETKNDTDKVSAKLDIRIRQNEDYLDDDENSMDLFKRISVLNARLRDFNQSQFATEMKKYVRVKNPIVKTNAIRKNPNFKACYELWVFLYNYHDVGYEINVYEQSTEIRPEFEQDIYNSIFFNYMILKNYLDREEDRLIDMNRRFQKRVLKPRYIKKIIEEIVGNYDITDVEIRKVLIEEFTRAQLEQLEAKERRKLVEERERRMAEKRKKEAAEKKKKQEKLQMERAKRLRQQEQEKARKLKAAQKKQQNIEKLAASCIEELKRFETEKAAVLEKREKERLKEETKLEKAEATAKRRAEKKEAEKEARKAEREAKKLEREQVKAEVNESEVNVADASVIDTGVVKTSVTDAEIKEKNQAEASVTSAEVKEENVTEVKAEVEAQDEEIDVKAETSESVEESADEIASEISEEIQESEAETDENEIKESEEIENQTKADEKETEENSAENQQESEIENRDEVEEEPEQSESEQNEPESEEAGETEKNESEQNESEAGEPEQKVQNSEETHNDSGIAGAFRSVWRRIRGE